LRYLFFCRENNSSGWKSYPSNLTSYPVLDFLANGLTDYLDWAEDYYEKTFNHYVLKEVFVSLKINIDQLSILNPNF
jgi:hypothetical protein